MEQRDGSLHIYSNICASSSFRLFPFRRNTFLTMRKASKVEIGYALDPWIVTFCQTCWKVKWKLKVTSLHNKFPETCIVRVMDFVQSGQYPFQLIICSFSNLHIVHWQELAVYLLWKICKKFRCPNMYLLSVECRRLIRRQEADNWCVSFNIFPRPRRFDRLINHGRDPKCIPLPVALNAHDIYSQVRKYITILWKSNGETSSSYLLNDKKQDAFMFEEVTSRNDRGWCELMLVVVVEHMWLVRNGEWASLRGELYDDGASCEDELPDQSRARAFFNSLNKVVVCGDGHGYGRRVYKRPVRGVQSIGTSLFRLTNSVDCFRKDLGEHKWGRPSIAYSLASSEDLCRAVAGINCTRLRELRKSVNNNNTSERDADGIDHFPSQIVSGSTYMDPPRSVVKAAVPFDCVHFAIFARNVLSSVVVREN
ncbi:hypothetical protein T07_3378 [Trichinella nelsoni]|uniref:Uncharacterized protein n=1 Tax=Trichinella nelsoni TaxID=6336 RepID=A0A0V0RMF0_9BILA|nr:hypothetical protein T07_3378 [Trichinella nelsoni]